MRISCLTRNEERQNEKGTKYSKEETASELLTTVSHLRWARCPLMNHLKFHFTLDAASKLMLKEAATQTPLLHSRMRLSFSSPRQAV